MDTKILLLIFLMSACLSIQAATNSSTATNNITKEKSEFAFTTQIATSTNLYDPSDVSHSSSLSASLAPSLRLGDYKLSSSIVMNQSLQTSDLILYNIPLTVSFKNFRVSESLSLKRAVSLTLPTNEVDRLNNTFVTAINASTGASTTVKVINSNINIGYSLSAKKNIHTYKRNNLGSPNNEFTIVNRLIISKNLTKSLALELSNDYYALLDYNKTLTQNYAFDQSLTYAYSKQILMTVGHSIGGGVFSYDGVTSNVELYNPNKSQLYMALTISN